MYIPISIGGGKQFINNNTGKPVRNIRREKIGEVYSTCDECGIGHKESIYNYSLDKRVKLGNIGERILPPTKYFIPVYSE